MRKDILWWVVLAFFLGYLAHTLITWSSTCLYGAI